MKSKKTETKKRGTYEILDNSENEMINRTFDVRKIEENDVAGGSYGYPNRKVVKKSGVLVEHYYPNDHGNPAHLHVKGGGESTKIGPQGKPIKGQPQLSAKQAGVISENLPIIKKVIKKIQKELRKQSK